MSCFYGEGVFTKLCKKNIMLQEVTVMRHKKDGKCGIGAVLAIVAFLGALMCVSFFSIKVLLLVVAVLLIVIGIFLLRL